MEEKDKEAIVDGGGNGLLASVIESTDVPGLFCIVVVNADGSDIG